ncbi:MAG: transcriptional regulator [Caulobacteraceae bacterium]|nr:transcriptional regulator [Caulobacteraceae bacterium]
METISVASTQTILLVEDEMMILDLLHGAFIDAGYAVVMASDGREALLELEIDADRFDGVVTDIRLGPGPDGWRIGHRARELSPHIQVVYVSGDSGHDWLAKGVPDSTMVSKPFAVDRIVTAFPPSWFRRTPGGPGR